MKVTLWVAQDKDVLCLVRKLGILAVFQNEAEWGATPKIDGFPHTRGELWKRATMNEEGSGGNISWATVASEKMLEDINDILQMYTDLDFVPTTYCPG